MNTSDLPLSDSGSIPHVFKESADFCTDLDLTATHGEQVQTEPGTSQYPQQFSHEARARLVAVRTQEKIAFKQSSDKFNSLFEYALNVSSAFANECCQLVKSNRMAVEEMERLVPEFRDVSFYMRVSIAGTTRGRIPVCGNI